MRGNLNETCGFGKIETCVANLGEKDGVDERIVLEIFENAKTLVLWCCAVNVRFAELARVLLQGVDVVGEYYNLVS